MDNDDAALFAIGDARELRQRAIVMDFAVITACGINPRQDLHQRRLACAIFPDKGKDLSLFYGQIHLVQGFDTREFLGDPAHFQQRSHSAVLPSITPQGTTGVGAGRTMGRNLF